MKLSYLSPMRESIKNSFMFLLIEPLFVDVRKNYIGNYRIYTKKKRFFIY